MKNLTAQPCTDRSRAIIAPGIIADARRALFLEAESTLVVADLHLAYVWAHRHGGQLLPISVREDTSDRLAALQQEYRPRSVVLLGDLVHRAVPVKALEVALRELLERLSVTSEVILLRGNHDRQLEGLLDHMRVPHVLRSELQLGPYQLAHGDVDPGEDGRTASSITIMGHEHPAIWLDDGGVSGARCPCFLVAEELIVLPAFSRWAAGSLFGQRPFLSPRARAADFTSAFAILGERILPVRL